MPYVQRPAPRTRLAARRFLVMLLWATSGAAGPVATRAADDNRAPVLRVARDQPHLGALRAAPETETPQKNVPQQIPPRQTTTADPPLSSRRTANTRLRRSVDDAPATTVEQAPIAAAPPEGDPSPRIAVDAASDDGWVRRDSLRRQSPSSDPAPAPAPAPKANSLPLDQPILDGERALADEGESISEEAAPIDAGREETSRDDSSADEYGWIEIVPESIGAEPIPVEDAEPDWSPEIDEEVPTEHEEVVPAEPEEEAWSDPEPEEPADPRSIPLTDPEPRRPRDLDVRQPRELEVRRPRDMTNRQPRVAENYRREEPATRRQSEAETGPQSEPEVRQPAPIITAAARRLERSIEQSLQYYYQRPENASERTPWGMLHAILPYGLDATIQAGPRRYNAIAWLAGNNPSRNQRLLTVSRGGRIEARIGVGLQGHQAQLLAILAQVGVPIDYPLHVNGRRFTVSDLIQSEMAACRAGEELTFTLIGLSHYLPTDTTWRASDGQHWDFERLIREELRQPVIGAACGGTHRLMGLSYALTQRRREGLPEDGQWDRAAIFIDDFVEYAWRLQNRDGSFSTQWFEGREDNNDLDRKLQTSGHILEWLVFNATEEQLQEERMDRAVAFIANAMLSNRGNQWQVGPKGHALRAMSLYHRRVFGSEQPWLPSRTASSSGARRR